MHPSLLLLSLDYTVHTSGNGSDDTGGAGCTDVDDALSVRQLPNGQTEVGVHIADVSHFVQKVPTGVGVMLPCMSVFPQVHLAGHISRCLF